nr:PREDICTED: histone-lysine N-methyltransferase Su(var)3-9-like [Bemisia tabaci]XP_018908705.1 PREDICTED: histone-lysine N-methyltransferase Su(var)3-9-like [Bemisia tabaci]
MDPTPSHIDENPAMGPTCAEAIANLEAIMNSAQDCLRKLQSVSSETPTTEESPSKKQKSSNESVSTECDSGFGSTVSTSNLGENLPDSNQEMEICDQEAFLKPERNTNSSEATDNLEPSSTSFPHDVPMHSTNIQSNKSAGKLDDPTQLIASSTQTPREEAISNYVERRFVLVGSPMDRSYEVRPYLKLRKNLAHPRKTYLLSQCSPGKFSPQKNSPSRRTSILQPLSASPSTADYFDRKHSDCSSSPRRFASDLPTLLKTPFSSDLFSKKSGLVDNLKEKQIEDSRDASASKKVNPGPVPFDKRKRKRKTPFIYLKKFTKPKKNSSVGDMLSPPEEYEVEYIESHKILENNECMFFVKWIGWDASDNTWEPITNLLNCQEKLVGYFEQLLRSNEHKQISLLRKNANLRELRQTLSRTSEEELNQLLSTYRSSQGIKLPVPNRDFIDKALLLFTKQLPKEMLEPMKKRLRHELLLEKLCAHRKAQLVSLQEWELEINFLAQNSALITVENNVDLEGPPPNFNYINHYLPGAGVIIPNDPPFGCDCPGGCTVSSQLCCGKESGFAYDQHGRIKVPRGTPIYECNNRCTCPVKCRNRVIQRGQHYRLCIFKTSNGCGWGVKALDDIKKGSFITKYVGEVVTAEEAAVRSNTDSKFYLFDLDFNCPDNSPCPFTVDASVYGNISHFINHSCDPNLAIYASWINCLDPNLPLLVLFAIKDIRKGEELCFSYSQTDTSRRRKGEVKCRCNTANCRKYVF